jgi:hypothetical protein
MDNGGYFVNFNDPFYTLLPKPPLGAFDPCYSAWLKANRLALEQASVCRKFGSDSAECQMANEKYFEAARQFAFCMDEKWGLDEF